MKKKIHVLSIEDNPGDAFLLEELLSEDGDFDFIITQTGTLREATALLENKEYDIILLDLGLPDSKGLSGLQSLLDMEVNPPIVVITGLNNKETGRQAVELGAQSYMIKGEFGSTSIVQTILYSIDRTKFLKKIRQREEQLKLKNIQLEEANSAKNLLISTISHDLRGPVESIVNLLEILNDNFDDIENQKKKKYIETILLSAANTGQLLENLLFWARAQNREKMLKPKPINIRDVVAGVIDLQNATAQRKQIEMVNKVPGQYRAFADKEMIDTVLRNLLSNALKFTPRNERVTVSAQKKNSETVVISVEDTGTGIEEEVLESLFKVEKTTSLKGTENEPGSGFGLFLCKEFITKNQGEIWIESSPGAGTKVSFSLPAAMAE